MQPNPSGAGHARVPEEKKVEILSSYEPRPVKSFAGQM